MNIRELVPIGDNDGEKIVCELSSFLGNFASQQYIDVKCMPAAIRIIAAFAAYDKSGRVEDFIARLNMVNKCQKH